MLQQLSVKDSKLSYLKNRFDVQVFGGDFLDQPGEREPGDQVVGRLLVTPDLFQGQGAGPIAVRLSRRLRRSLLSATGRSFRKLSSAKLSGRNFRSEF